MHNLIVSRIKQKLQGFDWTLLRGSALLSVGTAVARVLGLAFSLVLAAVFSASDYGSIRYAITIATVVAIGTQPFGQHVIARFVGKNRADPERVDSSLSNLFAILPVLFVLTLAIAIPVLHRIGHFDVAILAVFAGLTLFYAYWGLSAGFLEPKRLTIAYLGSNLVQIILVYLLIQVLGIKSPALALLIYGLSYVIPLALLVFFWPFPGRISLRLVSRRIISDLLRFSVPIWISHACYTLTSALDLIILEKFVSGGQLGAYSLSKTLATVFVFVPAGISTLLMPKVASSPAKNHRPMLIKMLGISLLVSGILLAVYLPVVTPFTRRIFGADYMVLPLVSVLLAVYMITEGIHGLITAIFVGSGKPEAESASRIMDLALTSLGCWLLIPQYQAVGAALSILGGKFAALITYGILVAARGKKDKQILVQSAEDQG